MKKFIPFLMIALVAANCCSEKRAHPAVEAFYADGSIIDDTTHLYLLKRELPKILKANNVHGNGLKVYTSLRANVNEELKKLLKPMEDSIYPNIDWSRSSGPNLKRDVEHARKHGKFFDAAVVAIDNRTGQIVTYFSSISSEERDGVTFKAPVGVLQKTFSFALAMQEEFSPNDRYPQANLVTGEPDTSVNHRFKTAFIYETGTIHCGLDRRYSKTQAADFLHRLEIDYEGETGGLFHFLVGMSLLDVTKTYSVFYNKGFLIRPSVIDSIADRNGKVLYRNPQSSEKVMSHNAAFEMMQLLDAYANQGIGRRIASRPDTPAFCGNFGQVSVGHNGNGWFMTVQGDYTIGIRNFTARRDIYHLHKTIIRQQQEMTVPLWLKTVEMLRKDGRPVPELLHYGELRPTVLRFRYEPLHQGPAEETDNEIRTDIQLR